MKTLLLSVILLVFTNQLSAQTVDTSAFKVVDSQLKIIRDHLEQKEKSLQKISDAVMFLTGLTGIASEVAGTYYAEFKPTKMDLELWTAWYQLNKDYLFWDKELQLMVLYKKVKIGQ